MPPKKVFLHVGLHKTGTTYLQSLWNLNREGLRAQGVEYPGGPGEPSQVLAAADLLGRRPRGHDDNRVAGSWKSLVEHLEHCDTPTALVSQEGFGFATLKYARLAVAGFPDSEVHVVVTARDLGRVLVSMWQEEVKNDRSWTWREYVDAAKDPEEASRLPALGFWRRADVVRVCDTWASVVGAQRLHVVTVPPAGGARDELLNRVASVVGFDPALLAEEPAWSNEMVGAAGTEVLRRVNQLLAGRLNQRQHSKAVRETLVPLLVRNTTPDPLGLPSEEFGWVSRYSEEMISALESRGYAIVGDADDLRPRRPEGLRNPDDAGERELLDTAVEALALLTERYAKSWWLRRRDTFEGGEEKGTVASRFRGTVYRGKVKAVALAEHNALASKALNQVLRAEDRKLRKARSKGHSEVAE